MAEVYKAYHPGLQCHVAIKVLHSFLAGEEDFLTRFEREARTVATFRHPNIIQIFDFDSDVEDRCYYMVMELIDGLTLKERLQEMAQKGQKMPLDEAVHIVVAVADALDYAHRHGMVHRDIKPSNIMFTQDEQIILTDFGIARMVDTTPLTASGAMVGTPAYMAPEQGLGRARDERADIYSLGVVLYQLAAGALPFDADTPMAIVLKHIHAPLTAPRTLNPDLPPAVEAVIIRALAKDPDLRYQSASEFADDLKRSLAGEYPVAPVSPELATASTTVEIAANSYVPDQTGPQEWSTSPGIATTPVPRAIPAARPKRGWLAVLAAALVLILLGSAALLTTQTPSRVLAALFPPAATPAPGVTGTPTHTTTPDLTATHNANATQFAAWMATYEATTGVTPTPSPTPTATPTPDLTATAIAACVFDLEVVNDQQVWPSVLMPGQQFVKHWTIQNVGTCAWPEDVHLVFTSGDELDVVERPEIEPLAPGETTEVAVTLRALTVYDSYTSVWQLQDGAGKPIGEKLEVTCRVGPTPTPRPTATSTATPTPEVSPTPMETLHFSVPFIVEWHDIPGGEWWAQVGLTAWGGDGSYRYYLSSVSEENEFFYGAYEFQAQLCKSWIGTVIVQSGDGQEAAWKGLLPYPDPKKCE